MEFKVEKLDNGEFGLHRVNNLGDYKLLISSDDKVVIDRIMTLIKIQCDYAEADGYERGYEIGWSKGFESGKDAVVRYV